MGEWYQRGSHVDSNVKGRPCKVELILYGPIVLCECKKP
jgi:hypothetical protein